MIQWDWGRWFSATCIAYLERYVQEIILSLGRQQSYTTRATRTRTRTRRKKTNDNTHNNNNSDRSGRDWAKRCPPHRSKRTSIKFFIIIFITNSILYYFCIGGDATAQRWWHRLKISTYRARTWQCITSRDFQGRRLKQSKNAPPLAANTTNKRFCKRNEQTNETTKNLNKQKDNKEIKRTNKQTKQKKHNEEQTKKYTSNKQTQRKEQRRKMNGNIYSPPP